MKKSLLTIPILLLVSLGSGCSENIKSEQQSTPNNLMSLEPESLIGVVYDSGKEADFEKAFNVRSAMILTSSEIESIGVEDCYYKGKRLVLLKKLIHNNAGNDLIRILDVWVLENDISDQSIIFGTCNADGKSDPMIFAIGELTNPDSERHGKIFYAWKVSIELLKIIKISPEKIYCINEGAE